MNNYTRNILLISAIVISSLGAYSFYLTKQDYAADSVIFNTSKNIAINGYDTVSYQLDKRPQRGSATYQVSWAGSIWYFISLKNRELFTANPEKYAPQLAYQKVIPHHLIPKSIPSKRGFCFYIIHQPTKIIGKQTAVQTLS
jgi:YHS domain-containing protein